MYDAVNLFDIAGRTLLKFARNILVKIFTTDELKTRKLRGNAKLRKLDDVQIRLPCGKGIWPAFWLLGNAWDKYKYYWPTVGGIDIVEMIGGKVWGVEQDSIAYGHAH
ncbi:unnamed protein product [Didymodactylos carnosus]|uniref:GH16 domain-containing protein n=1 Tax=Didymodactylos carnosus TaxID=1234261 RepID=A0A814WHH5_9BILA|nr:unnamed protein product [Didymodactylos carnosus]CAF3966718.1 unnamed protein product [Didymodactylos carnosus]